MTTRSFVERVWAAIRDVRRSDVARRRLITL